MLKRQRATTAEPGPFDSIVLALLHLYMVTVSRSFRVEILKEYGRNNSPLLHQYECIIIFRTNPKSNHPQAKHHPSSRNKNIRNAAASASAPIPHALHSHNVRKLDADTTAEEVVTAIKRAQNTRDLHDVREIGQFLLEEVGE